MKTFEPKIIGFLCNWCAYAGADLAGVSRFQYPPSIRIIRVLCTGRIEPMFVIELFLRGADGVFIGGCHFGDCHYSEGNYHAEKKIKMLNKLLEYTHFDPERLKIEWIAASEGERFASLVKNFTEKIKEKGPNPVSGPSPDMKIIDDLTAAKSTVEDFRLRAIVSKEKKLTETGNVYGDLTTQADFDTFFDDAIFTEFTRNQILHHLSGGALSVMDLSNRLLIPPDVVLDNIVILKKNNQIALDSIEGRTPKYISLLEGGD